MTSYEFEALSARTLSHQARSLYIFYLRPKAVMGPLHVDMGALSDALVSYSSACPFQAAPALIQELLLELEHHSLINIRNTNNVSMDGALILMPFLDYELRSLPSKPFIMHSSWRPGPAFAHAAKVSGLLDPNYSEKDLQSFIDYWSQKAESRNQAAWERAFVLRLKRMRQSASQIKHRSDTNQNRSPAGYDIFGNPFY